jgi:hypothetical protein
VTGVIEFSRPHTLRMRAGYLTSTTISFDGTLVPM